MWSNGNSYWISLIRLASTTRKRHTHRVIDPCHIRWFLMEFSTSNVDGNLSQCPQFPNVNMCPPWRNQIWLETEEIAVYYRSRNKNKRMSVRASKIRRISKRKREKKLGGLDPALKLLLFNIHGKYEHIFERRDEKNICVTKAKYTRTIFFHQSSSSPSLQGFGLFFNLFPHSFVNQKV